MKRTKIIPIQWIPENHDSDLDGVPNYRDCQPFNPRRQDDNISIAKRYLRKAITDKSEKPIENLMRFMKSLNKKERDKIIMNDEFLKLLYTITRKALPEINSTYVPFGPY